MTNTLEEKVAYKGIIWITILEAAGLLLLAYVIN